MHSDIEDSWGVVPDKCLPRELVPHYRGPGSGQAMESHDWTMPFLQALKTLASMTKGSLPTAQGLLREEISYRRFGLVKGLAALADEQTSPRLTQSDIERAIDRLNGSDDVEKAAGKGARKILDVFKEKFGKTLRQVIPKDLTPSMPSSSATEASVGTAQEKQSFDASKLSKRFLLRFYQLGRRMSWNCDNVKDILMLSVDLSNDRRVRPLTASDLEAAIRMIEAFPESSKIAPSGLGEINSERYLVMRNLREQAIQHMTKRWGGPIAKALPSSVHPAGPDMASWDDSIIRGLAKLATVTPGNLTQASDLLLRAIMQRNKAMGPIQGEDVVIAIQMAHSLNAHTKTGHGNEEHGSTSHANQVPGNTERIPTKDKETKSSSVQESKNAVRVSLDQAAVENRPETTYPRTQTTDQDSRDTPPPHNNKSHDDESLFVKDSKAVRINAEVPPGKKLGHAKPGLFRVQNARRVSTMSSHVDSTSTSETQVDEQTGTPAQRKRPVSKESVEENAPAKPKTPKMKRALCPEDGEEEDHDDDDLVWLKTEKKPQPQKSDAAKPASKKLKRTFKRSPSARHDEGDHPKSPSPPPQRSSVERTRTMNPPKFRSRADAEKATLEIKKGQPISPALTSTDRQTSHDSTRSDVDRRAQLTAQRRRLNMQIQRDEALLRMMQNKKELERLTEELASMED